MSEWNLAALDFHRAEDADERGEGLPPTAATARHPLMLRNDAQLRPWVAAAVLGFGEPE